MNQNESQAEENQEKPRESNHLEAGTQVRIRYDTDKSWSRRGTIVNKRPEPRSYNVQNDRGNVIRVNERHILPAAGDTSQPFVPIKIEDDFDVEVSTSDSTLQAAVGSDVYPTTQSSTTSNQVRDTPLTTRSGRTVQKPSRYR